MTSRSVLALSLNTSFLNPVPQMGSNLTQQGLTLNEPLYSEVFHGQEQPHNEAAFLGGAHGDDPQKDF